MVTRLSRPEQAERVRTELLEAARTEFLRAGYHGATLDQIAATAGYTKGVVYSRFASKADLFLALLEERIEQRLVQNEAFARTLEGVGGVDELVQRWAEIQTEDEAWTLLVIEFRVHASRDPELKRRYAALHERSVAGVLDVIERVLGDSDRVLAEFIFAMGTGTALERVADPNAAPPAAISQWVTALTKRGG
jgi:AcrR family transcriptional regulator